MANPPNPSKKHHYVPQAQLRHFAIDSDQKQIWVFDKQSGRSWTSSILSAGSENNFNTVELETGDWNFEYLFQDVDNRSPLLISSIVNSESLANLGPEDREALIDLFATQMLRTNLTRTTTTFIADKMREIVRGLGYDPDGDPDYATPSESSVRLGAVKTFLERDRIVHSMKRLMPALFKAGDRKKFILSDHPIVVANPFAYGDHGLQSHGIIVMLPVTPDFAIALMCPTIINRYESSDNVEIDNEARARINRYRDGFRHGSAVEIEPTETDGWNNRQVARSARFLYSAANDFDFARQLLAENPELKCINTHLQFGEMGRAPPAREGMPSGLQLVIQGLYDHCIIAVAEVDGAGEGLTARTLNINLLQLVANDQNQIQAELYEDGQQRRHIGQATIERFGDLAEGWFRVVHQDQGLREFARQHDKR